MANVKRFIWGILLLKKIIQILQCIRYRGRILGAIGKNNEFRPNCIVTSAACIGNNNYFGDRVIVSNAIIGSYCSFAPDVKIAPSQHSINYVTTYQKISKHNIKYSLLQNKTIIENDVWIGANAVIMQGVKVGNGAVIGANAVVTKDVPAYGIAVGVPAKLIRYRFDDILIDKLLESHWWDNPFDTACSVTDKIYKNFLKDGEY